VSANKLTVNIAEIISFDLWRPRRVSAPAVRAHEHEVFFGRPGAATIVIRPAREAAF
jgi:hypothetical protein